MVICAAENQAGQNFTRQIHEYGMMDSFIAAPISRSGRNKDAAMESTEVVVCGLQLLTNSDIATLFHDHAMEDRVTDLEIDRLGMSKTVD